MARLRLSALIAALFSCVLVAIPTSAMAAEMPGSLFDVHSVAVAPDGKHVYAGQGNGAPYVALSRDPATGLLTYLPKPIFPFSGSTWGEFRHTIAVSPDGRVVYDTLGGMNAIRVMNATGSSLEHLRLHRNNFDGISGLVGPNTLAFSPDGACLYVAAIPGQSLTAFRRDADNNLAFAASYSPPETPVNLAVSPEGAQLYAASGGNLMMSQRDPVSCELGPMTRVTTSGGGRMLVVSPDGTNIYAIETLDLSSRVVRAYTKGFDGSLTELETIQGGAGGEPGIQGTTDIAISGDGKHVYLTSTV
jgi:DNA-binding beta-propeller fold protein YncE